MRIQHARVRHPEYGGYQTDAGRDCRTRLADQFLKRERGQGNINSKSSRLPKSFFCGVVLMASTMLQHDVANRLLSYTGGGVSG